MRSGLLTGAFDHERIAALGPSDWRRDSPAFQEPSVSRNLDLVARLGSIAERIGATVPELAVGWVLAQPGVTAAIVGARLPRHADGWAGASDLEVEQSTLDELDDAVAASGAGSDTPPQPPPHGLPPARPLEAE